MVDVQEIFSQKWFFWFALLVAAMAGAAAGEGALDASTQTYLGYLGMLIAAILLAIHAVCIRREDQLVMDIMGVHLMAYSSVSTSETKKDMNRLAATLGFAIQLEEDGLHLDDYVELVGQEKFDEIIGELMTFTLKSGKSLEFMMDDGSELPKELEKLLLADGEEE